MFRTLILDTTLAVAALAALPAASAPSVSVTSSLDSAYILMGKQTAMHLQVVQDAGVPGEWIETEARNLTPEVYVIKATEADTTDLGNNRLQIERDLIIPGLRFGPVHPAAAELRGQFRHIQDQSAGPESHTRRHRHHDEHPRLCRHGEHTAQILGLFSRLHSRLLDLVRDRAGDSRRHYSLPAPAQKEHKSGVHAGRETDPAIRGGNGPARTAAAA